MPFKYWRLWLFHVDLLLLLIGASSIDDVSLVILPNKKYWRKYVGDDIELKCSLSPQNQEYSLNWTLPKNMGEDRVQITESEGELSLRIDELLLSDNGLFICHARKQTVDGEVETELKKIYKLVVFCCDFTDLLQKIGRDRPSWMVTIKPSDFHSTRSTGSIKNSNTDKDEPYKVPIPGRIAIFVTVMVFFTLTIVYSYRYRMGQIHGEDYYAPPSRAADSTRVRRPLLSQPSSSAPPPPRARRPLLPQTLPSAPELIPPSVRRALLSQTNSTSNPSVFSTLQPPTTRPRRSSLQDDPPPSYDEVSKQPPQYSCIVDTFKDPPPPSSSTYLP